jgi:predicted DNA repair protein MutK
MATSLLALLDDITSLLDDVAALTKTAATKTSGIMGDDLALNAQQVSGFAAERELPVVWGVAKGSLVNKVILVPIALLLSAFAPSAIQPVLMLGGLFLCFEGVEKLAHKWLPHDEEESTAEAVAHQPEPEVDLATYEKEKIKGAIRTDFVLSAEIVVIALGTLGGRTLTEQATVLAIIGVAATAFVYGLVAGIVKLDDLGLKMVKSGSEASVKTGRVILAAAPRMMRTLSIVGTAAMFTVGGGILVHGVHAVAHVFEGIVERVHTVNGLLASLVSMTLDGVFGVLAGAGCVVVYEGVKRLRRRPRQRPA